MEVQTGGKENIHILQVPSSPNFLRPKPIKLRKKIKRTLTPAPFTEVDINKKEIGFLLKSPKTYVNPFRREQKRKREDDNLDDDSNSLLWKQVNEASSRSSNNTSTLLSPIVPSILDENAVFAFSDGVSTYDKTEKEKQLGKVKCKSAPIDWSLKTKVRFTSPLPFPSRGSFRTFEEVNGTVGFVRCLHSEETDKRRSGTHSSHGAKFFQQCLVWMHPSIPWLNLFPRTNSKSLKQNNSAVVLDSAAQEILHARWCDSFRSLYQLVRLFQCPYFYMCTGTFTVLFRCAGAASVPVLHAFISPTTKGFRKALKEEGIAFTMPLCQKNDNESYSGELVDENLPDSPYPEDCGESKTTEEFDNDIEDDEPETWLESLGLSQDDFPSLNKKKRRSETSYQIDHKPESLVYVEDSETQALVNFLLNSQMCISKIGPMAGIPPTLLAPTAFLGGTLQSLKISHGKVKNEDKELDSVEISGPLLPNTIHSLCSLFNSTQEGNFSAVLTTHAPTSAFSMVTPQSPILPCIFAKNNLTDCGLPEMFVQRMCSGTEELTIKNITADNGLFSWK